MFAEKREKREISKIVAMGLANMQCIILCWFLCCPNASEEISELD